MAPASQTRCRTAGALQFLDITRARSLRARRYRTPKQADCTSTRVERDDSEGPSQPSVAQDASEVFGRGGANGRYARRFNRKVRSDLTDIEVLVIGASVICPPHAFVLPKAECVPHFFFFGPQICKLARVWRSFAEDLIANLDTRFNQSPIPPR